MAVWLRIPRGSALCREAQNLDFHVKMMTLQLKERQQQDLDQVLRGDLSGEGTSELKRAWGEGMMKPCGCVGGVGGKARAGAPDCSRNPGDWCDCAQRVKLKRGGQRATRGPGDPPVFERPFTILHLVFLSLITSQSVIEPFWGTQLLSKSCDFNLEPLGSNPLQ